MERQGPGEKQADANRIVATTAPITSTAVTMATVNSGCATCTQAPSASLSIISRDRQAVQVIQHAIHRPQSMAAQYLHQMYAAQQQHQLMLQTATLQQHQHGPHLQSLATIQKASVCQRQSLLSSSGSLVHQPAGVSQNSMTLPASPVTAHLIGRTQTSTGAATTISQQAMLLGNRPANCNQAQMYLRTQMLILTPAATVAAVQSDLPVVTSCSSLPTSSQVQNLALRAHLPGALATTHSVILKPSAHPQALTPATSLSKTSICGLKTSQLTDTSTETGLEDVTRLASGPQIITPAYSPVQTHTMVKQHLSCLPGQRVAHNQLILQQATGGAPNPRQLQPIALRVAPQETNANPLSLSVKRLTTHSTQSQTNNNPQGPSSSTSVPSVFASSAQTSIPAANVQPQPPPLAAAPQRRTSFPQAQNLPPPPPPPLVLPRLPQNPPASLQRLSLHSVQALAIHSGHMLLTEEELPVAEALVQMPYQNLPPPQTVAINLKVHQVRHNETTSSGQTSKVNGLSSEERKDECSPSPQRDGTLTPHIGPPKQSGSVMGSSSIISSHPVIRSPAVEEPSQLTTTSSNPPPLPPPALPAAVRGPTQPPTSPTSVPGSPDRILTTHVLTHLIEGFVIREGLEPFPVVSSSLLDQQDSLPESQEIQTNGDSAAEDSPLDAEQMDSTDSEMEDHGPAADVAELGESVVGVLQCEFCGSRGYAHTFLRSKRFCSMTCVRRFSVSCTKRITVLRAGHWGHRPMGRRGRPPSRRVNGASREHFLRQARRLFGSEESRQSSLIEEEEQGEEEEDEPPIPMTTRLRKQAERERQREREQEQRMTETISVSDGEANVGCPSQWNVEQVFSYINSLPGGQDVAKEFRSQEIDGQALLLLTEEHLVSTMNLKLGPALKLCAHINSLKDA
ncbi:polyhomeotic-like protein 3 isoform X1 [Etheostoma cragini]|uniref:polyhomeotic-like protein 3 isoform X1 n=1 Tax=Etheostoma cragini TaxID=417921 RepID=UPI00155F24FA|nr:polyhomeotic-like protein 3 isoform X1 [Etheostoma cragini]XP_034742589.1 polyhomeotic-like protein 3 isoform X1 [Etheostoma cragini]